jgi:hypothetical protein
MNRASKNETGPTGNHKRWRSRLFYRKEVLKTTWLVPISVVVMLPLVLLHSRERWLARHLVHQSSVAASDIVILDHYDVDYLVFETGASLIQDGLAQEAIIPCMIHGGPTNLNVVSQGIIDVMTGLSRLEPTRIVPVALEEPYTLNFARQMSGTLVERNIESVIIVSPAFRSRRSVLVYESVRHPLGIRVY